MGRSSDMFYKLSILVIGNSRRDFLYQLLWLLVKILLVIIDAKIIDPGKTFIFRQQLLYGTKDMIDIALFFLELKMVNHLRNLHTNSFTLILDDKIRALPSQVFDFNIRIMCKQTVQ